MTMKKPTEFFHTLRSTSTCAIERTEARALRLYYKTAISPPHSEHQWALQIRTPVSLANGGGDGKKSIAAIAALGVGDLRALRDAIDVELARASERDAYYADGKEFSVLDDKAPR